MKSKASAFILIILFFVFWCLPIISGRVAPLPESLDPSTVGQWLGQIISYWIELIRALIRQIKP